MKFKKFHGLTPFVSGLQQGMDAVIQRFFLNRAHIRFLQRTDIETDHVTWMLRKQGAEIVLRLRFI